jgi:hypothetical protein
VKVNTSSLATRLFLNLLALVIMSIALWFSSGGQALAATHPSYSSNSIHKVTCSDHMSAPWVAFYWNTDYGKPDLCFEGVGTIDLHDYGWADQISSINIAASGFAYDDNRNSFELYYGLELPNLDNINGSNWNDRIVGFIVSS